MKLRALEVVTLLILFFYFAPSNFAMFSVGVEDENNPPNIQCQRTQLDEKDYEQIISIVSKSIISYEHAFNIVNAVNEAAGRRKFGKRPISAITKPRTPPSHGRALTRIGKLGVHYGTFTPKKEKILITAIDAPEKVVVRDTSIRAIYSWIMVKEHRELYIDPNDLVDVEDYLAHGMPYSAQDVDEALLQTEITIRKWIQKDSQFVFRTVYVGLSVDAEKRIYGHRMDLNSKEFLNRKNDLQDLAGDSGYNVRMRPIIHHVPDELLPLFECLAGALFSAHIFSASTFIGNGEAKARLEKYWNSTMRRKKLEKKGLLTVTEDIKSEIFLRAKLLDSL